ncbi:transglutaminase-like domain-containing protein [Infirmifilum sp. NZ]|uniref:transglutaminase-like domain-containing protein n=1 Tax=Infirmifilum sp. NZ TaxID=2926850 RepID=UPI00279BB687|nr:transglutaminase-like domain-containing protein [Infirmifilum sp. NZ]UNQ73293.1 transglutaminase-like domain-containing protein [Infirmifilum sp. NZ]
MRCVKAFALLALALLAGYTLTLNALKAGPGVSSVEVKEVVFGTIEQGAFLPRPGRTFRVGETLAVRVNVVVSASPGTLYTLSLAVEVRDPLGAVLTTSNSSRSARLAGRSEEWVFTFAYNVTPDLITGYYTLQVTASAGGLVSSRRLDFFIESYASTRNVYEVTYTVQLTGRGEVKMLYLALPTNTSTTTIVAGPMVTPAPRSLQRDEQGNLYAVYTGVRVGPEPFKITVRFAALETVAYVPADAPVSSLAHLPDSVKPFLSPEEYIESDSPEIRALSRSLTAGSRTVLEAVRRIADYTSTQIQYNPALGTISSSWSLGALWTLHSRQGVCLQYSRLFVALARASGIPARVVGGLLALPPAGEDREYLHAWAEVYVPGYGWLPVEPQKPGSRVGVSPPAPGYIRLVAGLGGKAGSIPQAFLYYEYTGSVEVEQSYSYKQTPLEKFRGGVSLVISYNPRLLFGDTAKFSIETQPGTRCEVSVTKPDGSQYVFTRDCPCSFELKADKIGVWRVEVFAANPELVPAYGKVNFTVSPRPLSLSVSTGDVLLFKSAVFTVETRPPAPGINLSVVYEDCATRKVFALRTGEDGLASFQATPLLPCRVRVLVSSEEEGYEPAQAYIEVTPSPPQELYAAVLLLAALCAVLMRARRKRPD